MTRTWKRLAAAVLAAGIGTGAALAQFPASSAAGLDSAVATAAAAGPAPKAGLIKRICTGLQECRQKLCKTPLGAMANKITAPASALTGGIIPGFCPLVPSAEDLKKDGVEGPAAQAKKDAAEAAARRAAVRYLGTLDCRYYPEAELALIAALRTDPSECVRLEAAIGLYRGCCCTEKVVRALGITVSGGDSDGNPAERSERVRAAACASLEKCLMCAAVPAVEPPPPGIEEPKEPEPVEEKKEEEKKKEEAPAAESPNGTTASLTSMSRELPAAVSPKPNRRTLEWAQRVVNNYRGRSAMVVAQPATSSSSRGLFTIISNAADAPAPARRPVQAMPVMTFPATAEPTQAPAMMMPIPNSEPIRVLPPVSATPTLAPTAQAPAAPRQLVLTGATRKDGRLVAEVATAAHVEPADMANPAPAIVPAAHARPAPGDAVDAALEALSGAPTRAASLSALRALDGADFVARPEISGVLISRVQSAADTEVQVACLRCLARNAGRLPTTRAVLRHWASHPNPQVRAEAVRALAD